MPKRFSQWREKEILGRLATVAGMPAEQNFAEDVERSLDAGGVYKPRHCLLTACSTEGEEEERWPFMVNIKGSAKRSIVAARKVVGKNLRQKFGVNPVWPELD